MLFRLLKLYARFALKIYCRKVIINKPEFLKLKGPILFAANHPNSFLDGVILTTLFEENLYSLARGDAFKNKKYHKLLYWLRMLPIYRTTEGVENLTQNYTTFAACHNTFAKGDSVIIFSEGGCINEWHLRPLKKGTARLAISSWQKDIPLTVIPTGFNYNTFKNFGKNVFINFGEPLDKEEILQHSSDGKLFSVFNDQLDEQLKGLVYEIDASDKKALKEKLYIHRPAIKQTVLVLPAATGFLIHAPIYFLARAVAKLFDDDHFDSIVVAVLMLTYLIYLPILLIVCGVLLGWVWAAIGFIFIPFGAWACVQLKNQLD